MSSARASSDLGQPELPRRLGMTSLDDPESYLKEIKALELPALAVHLDPSNAVLTPRMLWSITDLINCCLTC
jgi:hypothetical protein